MSRNERAQTAKREIKRARRTDLRTRRTRYRLGQAIIKLMQQKPVDDLTVQEMLDHAGIGRSTFYLHFTGTEDLLLTQIEEGMEMWSTTLSRTQEKSPRVAPVAEFFAHAASGRKLYRALIDSRRIYEFCELAQGLFARGIARRL